VRVSHTFEPVFDDPNLISLGGLPAVMALAERAGLHQLAGEHVRVPGTAGEPGGEGARAGRGDDRRGGQHH
jgi:hypothetical protein